MCRNFASNPHSEQVEIEIESTTAPPIFSGTESKEFKAETRKLLDIVAKSIYTDKEVFIRELLSNCSDALEKRRFLIQSGKESNSSGADELYIGITTNSKERTFTLFDSGIGMDRDEIVDNLGTIAKSGSQAFVKNLNDTGVESNGVNDSIIGQFGVGFYSSFVVSNHVEVFSRKSGSEKGVRWVSDGCGTFEVSDVDNLDFERGTKIVLKLTPESREFSQETIVEKVCKKFS